MEPLVDYNLVKKFENRAPNDKKSFVFFGVIVLISLILVGYTLASSGWTPDRIFRRRCSNEQDMFYRTSECIEEKVEKFEVFWISSLNFSVALLIFGLFLLLFRFCPSVLVFVIGIADIILKLSLSYGVYCMYVTNYDDNFPIINEVAFGLVQTAIVIHIIIIIISLNKFRLAGFMIQQTMKIIFNKSFFKLWILPFIEVFSALPILALGSFTTYLMCLVFDLEILPLVIGIIANIFVTVWAVQIISTFFNMTISGSVATWYFNKYDYGFPMGDALKNTLKHHLGSIIYGTFIINLLLGLFCLGFLKIFSEDYTLSHFILLGLLALPIRILLTVPRYAYIEIAIHGSSFWDALKSVGSLFALNKLIFIGVNVLIDVTLGIIIALTCLLTFLITIPLSSDSISSEQFGFTTLFSELSIAFLFYVIFSIFRTTLDCLLLCFCEHARIAKQYSNVKELYEFIKFAGFIKYKLAPTKYRSKPTVKKVTYEK